MKKITISVCLILTLIFSMSAFATELPKYADGFNGEITGGNAEFSKAARDTSFLIGPWGSGAQVNGQFQDQAGVGQWNGWTHADLTQPTSNHWHVSEYNSPGGAGNPGAYCGDETLVACNEDDPVGGYGNNWVDILRFSYAVADPAAGCSITVSGVFNYSSEPGYDFTNFVFQTAEGGVNMASVDGARTNVPFSYSMSYGPADYVGENNDEVRFEINFTSDGAWSDADCLYTGDGAANVDDIHTTCSNGGYDVTETFDTDLGDWVLAFPTGTGDFTQIWTGLEDIDPCFTNYTPQVAFIDDGSQVAGVGPSYCQDWCYGPGGYIVNTTGGAAILTNPDAYLYNEVVSPVLEWPGSDFIGANLTFGVYRHEDLSSDSPGMFYTWSVRSSVGIEGLENANWLDRNLVYTGGPDYLRHGTVISDLIEPGATHAQIQLTCYELGWQFGWFGNDGYPAPYFDNVRFVAYAAQGPALATREIDIAQDNFPEIGLINLSNLADNNVRFDAAENKGDDELNQPGDSITCDVASVRVGGQLTVNRLVYTVEANPVFDPARSHPMAGSVDGLPVFNSGGNLVEGRWAYDLPDSGFLFPGDVLHYYFEATDEVDHANPQTATLPIDISGFGDFSTPQSYDSAFEVHCLPSVKADNSSPGILFWNDLGNRGGENEWYGALDNLGLTIGLDYDVYYTNAPTSGIGNGLGSRCSDLLMSRYSTLLYTSGDQPYGTIANGDPTFDPSRDIQLLTNFIAQQTTNVLLTGDDLASDLAQSGGLSNTFLQDYMNVTRTSNTIRPLINNQTAPLVLPEAGNSVFFTTPSWVAYGGCNGINTFDAVDAGPGAERLARFANPAGVASYTYSAATLNMPGDDKIISMPYDFMYLYTDINNPVAGGIATRVNVLKEIFDFFGVTSPSWNPTGVPSVEKFMATNYPNPFNPTTKIQFNLPKAGHLSLKIYNVRGELVRTLIDESRAAGNDHIMWDGTNDQGSNVSSGVYFYEARTSGEVVVNKMALVK